MGSQPASIHQHWSWLSVVYRVCDAACILGGLVVAGILTETIAHERFVIAATAAIGLYFIMAEITGVYRQSHGKVSERDVVRTIVTWAATLAALLAIGFVSRYATDASRKTLLVWLATTPVLITSARIVICWSHQSLVARGVGVRRCAVVGVNNLAFQLVKNVEQSPEHGLKIVGFYDDRPPERTPGIPRGLGDRVGDITTLVRQARRGEIDNIYITFPMRAEQRIRNVLEKLADSTASVYVVPDFFVFELLHSRWANFGGLPAVSVFENPLYGADGLVKRVVDFALATTALVGLALPMLVLAVLIKATSPGPVFFRQKRYGLDGRLLLLT
jgi:putative colanic acid biosynthesis UDP-glucose lipid carrier transferase